MWQAIFCQASKSIDFTFVGLCLYHFHLYDFPTVDEPGGGEKPSDEKRKEQTTPVVSPSEGSPEAKEER